MKFKAIINQRDGGRVILELSCREYHAQKLNYILSRTLDRSIYYDAAVVAVDAVDVETATARVTKKKILTNEQREMVRDFFVSYAERKIKKG